MLKDLVKQCRSYRRFYQDTVIPYSELADMVDTARLAASASNAQALKFKILCTPEECSGIFPYTAWAGALKDWEGTVGRWNHGPDHHAGCRGKGIWWLYDWQLHAVRDWTAPGS